MTISYIAHPIGGNVKSNLRKIRKIIRRINLEEPDIVPFAHYFVDCYCLNDSNPVERERGIKNDTALLKAGFINEIRLYGDHISQGMWNEIHLAETLGITIHPMTQGALKDYTNGNSGRA